MDATSWSATGCGLDVAGADSGADRGSAGGELGTIVLGLGEGDGSGVGGTEAADRMAPGGIDGGAGGEPAVCFGAAASSNAGATGSK